VVPDHPIFKGVPLDDKKHVVVFNPSVGLGAVSFNNVEQVGNGTLLAKTADRNWAAIAEWKAGIEFYPGSGQVPGGRRMLFAAGTMELPRRDFGRGEYNLNAHGKKLFLNAIRYMLNPASTEK